MPTFPPMIYVDYISHFFNLFWDRDELADAVLVMVFCNKLILRQTEHVTYCWVRVHIAVLD